MRVIGKDKIDSFARQHADARGQLAAWLAEVNDTRWRSFADVLERYPKASYLPARKSVIFNIKQNKYRLEVEVIYEKELVIIRRLGTHAEYNQW